MCLPHHLRCASHTLSLLGTTDFNRAITKSKSISRTHHPALAKCTTLWNSSRRPKSSEIIQEVLGCQLIYPCSTRWNSMFDSIENILRHKDHLNILLERLSLSSKFKEQEIKYLEEFSSIMRPIACALDCLQAQNNCYYGQLLPTIFSLRIRMQKLVDSQESSHVTALTSELMINLNRRFEKFFNLSEEVNDAIIATCFHPNFKLRWLPEIITETERNRIKILCIKTVEKIMKMNSNCFTSVMTDFHDEDDFLVLSKTSQQNMECFDNAANAEFEVVTFFNDQSKCFSSLDKYPNIRKAFIKYNTSLCSSAPVERLFSFAGFINSPTRGTLCDKTFETLLFLKGNSLFKN